MNQTPNPDSIQQSVLDRIRSGSVTRRSRAYFVLCMASSLALMLALLVVSALVVSLALFSIQEGGEQFLLGYGLRGVQIFFALFPWTLLLLDLALIACLELVVRGFKKTYRIPLLAIFFYLFVASVAAGAVISSTPLHDALFHRQRAGGLPVLSRAYEHVLDRHDEKGVFRGVVTAIATSTLTMVHDDVDQDHDDGKYEVRMPHGWNPMSVKTGDRVLIFGQPRPGGLEAEHAQVLPPL